MKKFVEAIAFALMTGISVFISLMLVLTTAGCSRDDKLNHSGTDTNVTVKKVAVVAPIGDAATRTRLERTAGWFAENFCEAQQDDTILVKLELEWYDELSLDLETLGRDLAGREDIIAVIGPFGNQSMAAFAPACFKTHKPLIAPTVTSEDIMRRYAISTAGSNDKINKKSFFWPLCQSDVVLTEVMLSHFVTQTGRDAGNLACAFITPDDKYGQTFYDWAPFHSRNLNVSLENNIRYNSTETLLSGLAQIQAPGFCIVETSRQLSEAAHVTEQAGTYYVFSSISEEGLATLDAQSVQALHGVSGFSPYADPATGFEQAYRERYSARPTFAECKFYDALILAGFAARMYECLHGYFVGSEYDLALNEWINSFIMMVTTQRGESEPMMTQAVWNSAGMRRYMEITGDLRFEPFCGASGYVIFDSETNMQTARTTYLNWQIEDGRIQHSYYYDPNGMKVAYDAGSWKYDETSALKDFADMAKNLESGISYGALTDRYAVLVQGSNGMLNYRHQADVLSMYQMLRLNGFDDDHIILIIDGALAHNPDNDEQGVIRNSILGHDLLGGTDALVNEEWRIIVNGAEFFDIEYPAAVPDYDSDTLTALDIADILTGRQSNHLPVVLPQDAGHNVLLYWSGHGRNVLNSGTDELVWRETGAGSGMTAQLLRQTFEQMDYRKVLTIVEPCYSEGVISPLHGLTGVLAMSGASGNEQSWAENWNSGLGRYGTWMYDRFTRNVVNFLSENPAAPFRDFYLYCMQNTIGSHVKLVNADYFDNLYTANAAEFIKDE